MQLCSREEGGLRSEISLVFILFSWEVLLCGLLWTTELGSVTERICESSFQCNSSTWWVTLVTVVTGDWWLWWLWCTAEIRRRTHHHWKERWCWFFHQFDKRTWPGWLVVVGHCWWFVKFVHFIFTKRSLVRFLADETKYRETNFSLNLPLLTCSVNVQSACRLACLCRLASEHQKRKIQFC